MNEAGIPAYFSAETVPPKDTLAWLIHCYEHDADSPIRKLRYSTKEHYRCLLARLTSEFDPYPLNTLNARTLLRWHEGWAKPDHEGEPPKVHMAHSMIGMLRTLVNFGSTILEDKDCERLALVMNRMRFEMGKPRTSVLTAEQVVAIRQRARALGLHSIALAQAFQFECTFRQKDVIGGWIPEEEKGQSDTLFYGRKWLSGLRWEEISDDLILTHITSKRQKKVEIDLKLAGMVMEELRFAFGDDLSLMPSRGPVIVCDSTCRPWTAVGFRRMWRRIADEVGIPNAVKNMDTRAGAITEALQSGAGLDAVRKAATHSNASMTQRYSRGDADDIADVMTKRAASRGAA